MNTLVLTSYFRDLASAPKVHWQAGTRLYLPQRPSSGVIGAAASH
jgi:hypothetical protein